MIGDHWGCPVLKTLDLVFIGSKSTLDGAIYYATEKMAKFLTDNTKLSFNEATIPVLRQFEKNWFFD